jgi:hypothetical protein
VPSRHRNSRLARTAFGVVLSFICVQPIVSAASGAYISDMPRQYPQAYNTWTNSLPHDCGDNMAGILFAPGGERVMAVVQMVGHNGSPVVMVVGQVSNAEYVCIRRPVADDTLSTC